MLPASSGGTSIFQMDNNGLENQIVALKSKSLVKKVIKDLHYNISYFIEGNIITTEAYKT